MQNIDNLCMGCMCEKGSETICSVCGFDETAYREPDALPLRTVLAGRYVVGKVIATDGEGFSYIGFDAVTESVIKINEYYPAGLCERQSDATVKLDSENSFVFNDGIMKFIELYKKLSELSELTAVNRVVDIFETNKTAYAVSEYLPGIRLKEFLIRNGGMLSWEQVRPLFLPLISAFKVLHEKGIIHGGISPETLMVGRDGKVRITGFCISEIRNAKSQMTAQLFPGYTAIEQYRGEEITPATDVYAFAATMFRTLTGNPPPDSMQRMTQDRLAFTKSIAESIPRSVLVAMANALQIEVGDRTSTMEQLKTDIQGSNEPVVTPVKGKEEEKTTPAQKQSTAKYVLIASIATALIIGLIGLLVYLFILPHDKGEDVSSDTSIVSSEVSTEPDVVVESDDDYVIIPDLCDQTMQQINNNEQLQKYFDIVVREEKYDDKYARGRICGQYTEPNKKVAKKDGEDVVIEVIVSMGPSEIKIPKQILNKTEKDARIILYELGFKSDTITFIEKMDDEQTEEKIVIGTYPEIGETVRPYDNLIVYINANLKPEEEEETSSKITFNIPSAVSSEAETSSSPVSSYSTESSTVTSSSEEETTNSTSSEAETE